MDQNQNIHKYLYHYTNVDSLALIMKNKTIRLNSLDKMDDLQEQMSEDKQNFGKFVFVSSWTAEETESIPMWRMYTPKQRGVRIKLPINPFVEYNPTIGEIAKYSNSVFSGDEASQSNLRTIIPISEVFNGEFFLTNYAINSQLFEVKYTDDDNLLRPTVLKIINDKFSITLSDIGIYKNNYWEFQKEWRYRLMFLPISVPKLMQEQMQGINTEMEKLQLRTIAGQAALSFNHYDLKIRDDSFTDMNIILAPDISESSKEFVELLVKEYCTNCTINESVLTNLIQ
jgi:PIN domain nuclease of toxin-antitoxin system